MGRNYNNRGKYNVVDNRNPRFEHDDRGGMDKSHIHIRNRLGPKRVGFDVGTRGGGIQKRDRRLNDRQVGSRFHLLPDEDATFEDRQQAGRGRPLHGNRVWRRGRGESRPMSRLPVSQPVSSNNTWYKMKIRNGQKYDKTLMLKEMLSRSKVVFAPLCYEQRQAYSAFYVDDVEAAKALRDLNNTIEMPDGFSLQITMEATTPPNFPINDDLVEKIKTEMSKRYNVEKKALNLNAFHKSFAGESTYAPLWRSNVLRKVMDIVIENIQDVVAIDLSNNKMLTLDGLSGDVKNRLQNLRILYLKDNRLANSNQLDKIKGLQLTELNLLKNPIRDRMAGNSYADKIRLTFPTLQTLDEKPMPKKIGFDEDPAVSTNALPLKNPKFVKSEEAGALVLQFLEQYFKLFDSDSRQPLLDAYDEKAMMSMSCYGARESMKVYLEDSRNFLKVSQYKKQKFLYTGRLPIVSFLSKLPKTQHDPTTFTLDLTFTSASLMMFTVSGMFKEVEDKEKRVRHFNRCFLVVPKGSGFCIVNETLFIVDPTAENQRRAFTSPESSMTTMNTAATSAASPVQLPNTAVDINTQKTLAEALSRTTGMNLEWSARALTENQWNYDQAALMFQQAKAENKIPPEAFVKST